jgi:hypothetical protein
MVACLCVCVCVCRWARVRAPHMWRKRSQPCRRVHAPCGGQGGVVVCTGSGALRKHNRQALCACACRCVHHHTLCGAAVCMVGGAVCLHQEVFVYARGACVVFALSLVHSVVGSVLFCGVVHAHAAHGPLRVGSSQHCAGACVLPCRVLSCLVSSAVPGACNIATAVPGGALCRALRVCLCCVVDCGVRTPFQRHCTARTGCHKAGRQVGQGRMADAVSLLSRQLQSPWCARTKPVGAVCRAQWRDALALAPVRPSLLLRGGAESHTTHLQSLCTLMHRPALFCQSRGRYACSCLTIIVVRGWLPHRQRACL